MRYVDASDVDRLLAAREAGVILASGEVEARIRDLIMAGHDENAAARIAFSETYEPRPEDRLRARQQTTVHAMLLNGALGARRKGGRMPRQRWIDGIEVEYAGAILKVVEGWRDNFERAAVALPRLLASSNARRDVQEEPLAAERILEVMRETMEGELNQRNLRAMAKYFGERTNREQRAALSKQLSRALGVEVIPDDKVIPQLVEYFSAENAALISSIPRRLQDEVSNLTMRAFRKKMDPDTFAAELEKRFGIARSRALLIARDQLGSLYGQLNQTRQTALGITHYIWDTRRDRRVRPEHRARQGVRYAWDELGPDEIPGAPIACRCSAIPDLSDILELYSKAKRGRR